MVYAIMSIGVLGFIVWSQFVMALQHGNVLEINFTIGWKDSTLLATFYCKNANNYIQSAGNFRKKRSSETIRENNFDLFKKAYSFYFKQEFKYNDQWLYWLIGFIEGDGAILEHKGRLFLIITQKNYKILEYIKNTFNMGKVYYHKDKLDNIKYGRYKIFNNNELLLIYLLLNGNLALNHRINQLSKWRNCLINLSKLNLNRFNLDNIPFINNLKFIPTLKDSWISGFTDAEGCFSVYIEKNKNKIDYVKCRFILDQKNEFELLNHILFLFSSDTKNLNKRLKTNNVYRLTISCNDYKNYNSFLIREYFNNFQLKTTKLNNFLIWSKIIDLIHNKQPLSQNEFKEIKKLRTKMNKYIIDNNPIGYSNKS